MRWVTRAHVGIDRIGCAWLIRRFVDSEAVFEFVAADGDQLPTGAEPFDIPGARLSHRRGHASFHTILEVHGLVDPVLVRLARIVDEADTAQEVAVEPAAPGLDLICEGLRLISGDDALTIERGALIFDALYARLAADQGS